MESTSPARAAIWRQTGVTLVDSQHENDFLPLCVLDDPWWYDADLSLEILVRLEVARKELLLGDRPYAERILRGQADRDPRVHFGIFHRTT